jgi:exopolysaccharide biosynthesis protein
MTVRELNRFFLLVCGPFIGMLIWLGINGFTIRMPELNTSSLELFSVSGQAASIIQNLDIAQQNAMITRGTIETYYQLYEKSASEATAMLAIAAAQVARPHQIFENRVSAVLGRPIRTVSSGNIDLRLYSFKDPNYQGYALKVNLKNGKAMKMVLGEDKVGGSETTLEAAKRYGAVAGVNAGGFADGGGKRYPLSTTVLDGKYVYGFEPTFDDLTFVGLSKSYKLIGGKFSSQAELDKLDPLFGATFVPALLKNGVKLDIPTKWLTSPRRAPRTVIGNFGNDQLLFIVVDGYNENGSSGATLPEMQDKLLQLRIKDAYNLDGGGSSSLIFEGQVINSPSDGRLRKLPTHFLFFK